MLRVGFEQDSGQKGRVIDRGYSEGRKCLGVALGAGGYRLRKGLLSGLVLVGLGLAGRRCLGPGGILGGLAFLGADIEQTLVVLIASVLTSVPGHRHA